MKRKKSGFVLDEQYRRAYDFYRTNTGGPASQRVKSRVASWATKRHSSAAGGMSRAPRAPRGRWLIWCVIPFTGRPGRKLMTQCAKQTQFAGARKRAKFSSRKRLGENVRIIGLEKQSQFAGLSLLAMPFPVYAGTSLALRGRRPACWAVRKAGDRRGADDLTAPGRGCQSCRAKQSQFAAGRIDANYRSERRLGEHARITPL